MRILYLADDYPNSSVHHNLAQSLCEYSKDNDVVVFSSLRKNFSLEDSFKKYGKYSYEYLYKNVDINHLTYKINFWKKRNTKFRLLLQSVNVEEIDIVLVSTMFSDGAVALELFKKYNIPYIISVRGTDTNLYLKKLPHLWNIGRKVLLNAIKIIFIAESIKSNFILSKPLQSIIDTVINKSVVIPNGIDKIWINNLYIANSKKKAKNILYVGDFSKNKNVISVLKAFEKLQQDFPDIMLNLVGGGGKLRGNQEKIILDYVKKNDSINYLGKIYDREKLIQVMRNNDAFVMVSHSETFGLVYIEALSQGLPIVYTEGQGVDGFFDDIKVGEKANSKSIDSIYNAMKKIIEDYPSYENIGERINQFTWGNNSKMIDKLLKK